MRDGLNMVLILWSSVQGVSLLKVPYRFTQWELTFAGMASMFRHTSTILFQILAVKCKNHLSTSFVAICQLGNMQCNCPLPLQQKLLAQASPLEEPELNNDVGEARHLA